MNDDTGNRRRATDAVTKDQALELVCTLAYENALSGRNPEVISGVEIAILKLRQIQEHDG